MVAPPNLVSMEEGVDLVNQTVAAHLVLVAREVVEEHLEVATNPPPLVATTRPSEEVDLVAVEEEGAC